MLRLQPWISYTVPVKGPPEFPSPEYIKTMDVNVDVEGYRQGRRSLVKYLYKDCDSIL